VSNSSVAFVFVLKLVSVGVLQAAVFVSEILFCFKLPRLRKFITWIFFLCPRSIEFIAWRIQPRSAEDTPGSVASSPNPARFSWPNQVGVVAKLAHLLGGRIDILVGHASPRPKQRTAQGRLQLLFAAASRLPRRQQEKTDEFVEGFVARQQQRPAA
jgi:hypothetical protein